MLATGDNPVAGTLNATTSAAALGSQACAALLVQNDPGSANNLLIGNGTNQYFSLKVGRACTIPCSNVSKVNALHFDQSSTIRLGTRAKSRTFRVTTIAWCSSAMAAMHKSILRTFSLEAWSDFAR